MSKKLYILAKNATVSILIFGMVFLYGFQPVIASATAGDPLPGEGENTAEESIDLPQDPEEALPDQEMASEFTESEEAFPEEAFPEEAFPEEAAGEDVNEGEDSEVEPGITTQSEESPAVTEAGGIEEKTLEEESPEVKVAAPVETWTQLALDKYQTTEAVKLGETYTYPEGGIELIFTHLPAEPKPVTVERINTSLANIEELASGVYNVTSDMVNGSFAYEISMDFDQAETEEPTLVYSETLDEFTEVAAKSVAGNKVEADLDHFTYFAVIDGYDEILEGWPVPPHRQNFSKADMGPDGVLGHSDDVRRDSAFSWPLLSMNLRNRIMKFTFGEAIPENAKSASLKFEYQRTVADYGDAKIQVKLRDGSWRDIGGSLWIDSANTDQTFNIDLTPVLDSIDPDATFRFQLYGADLFWGIPVAAVQTKHDWISLDVQTEPEIPGAFGLGTNMPPVGYQGDGSGIDNYVTCGGTLRDNTQPYRAFWGEADTGVANLNHYEWQYIYEGGAVHQGNKPVNYTAIFVPGVSGVGANDGEYLVRVRAIDSDGNASVDDATWADTSSPVVGATGTQGDWCKINIDTTPPDVPQNLGFDTPPGDPGDDYPEVDVKCGGYVNQNAVSHNWTDESASGAVKYQRQWQYPGSTTWHGAEEWATPYTNYRTFGGNPGTEGLWHVRVRAGDAAGNWSDYSDSCAVTFDNTSPDMNEFSLSETHFANSIDDTDLWVDDIDHLKWNYDVADDNLKVVKYAIWRTKGKTCDIEAMNAAGGGSIPNECRKGDLWKRWQDDRKVFPAGTTTASDHMVDIDDSWKDFGNGTYVMRMLVKDRAKNVTRSDFVWFGVDMAAANEPVVTFPSEDSYLINADMEFSADNKLEGIAQFGYTLKLYVDGADTGVSTFVEPDGHFEFSNTDLENAGLIGVPDYMTPKEVRVAYDSESVMQWSRIVAYMLDTEAPPVPTQLSPVNSYLGASSSVTLDWSDVVDVAPEASGLYRYELDITSSSLGGAISVIIPSSQSSYEMMAPDGDYTWKVRAVDAAMNDSDWSTGRDFTTDTIAPNVPANVSATEIIDGAATISWDSVAGADVYRVYRDGSLVAEVSSTNWVDTGLGDGPYTYYVSAVDAAGNESSQGGPASSSVAPADDFPDVTTGNPDFVPDGGVVAGVTTTAGNPTIGSGLSIGPVATGGVVAGATTAAGEEGEVAATEDEEGDNDDEGEVKGASADDLTAAADDQVETDGLMGLLKKWWFWLIIAIAVGFIIWASRRRKKDENIPN